MDIIKTPINDLIILKTTVYNDTRGSFKEVYKQNIYEEQFIFDCMSISNKNVLRGLHLQYKKFQGKLITVAKGEIFDVAVDLRKNSKTFGKHYGLKISENSEFSFYIPEGFAHGFVCLSDSCCVYYKCTNYRDEKSELTIDWKDPELNIPWPIKNPILSKKDQTGISLKEFVKKINSF